MSSMSWTKFIDGGRMYGMLTFNASAVPPVPKFMTDW